MEIKLPISKKLFFTILAISGFLFLMVLASHVGFINYKSNPVLFINNSCPHCEQTVSDIEDMEFKKSTGLIIKNIDNFILYKRDFDTISQVCDIKESQRGVPLLYHQKKCFKGRIEILQELERLNIER